MNLLASLLGIGLTVVASCAASHPVPMIVTPDVLSRSDTVFVGQLLHRKSIAVDVGATTFDVVADIRVERVLKSVGGLVVGQVVSVHSAVARGRDLQEGEHGMFPLRCAGRRGECESVMGFRLGWAALATHAPTMPAISTVDDLERAVADEVAAVIAASETALSSYSAARPLSRDDALHWRAEASPVLLPLPRDVSAGSLRAVGTPSDPWIRLAVVGTQMSVGDASGVGGVTGLMTGSDPALTLARGWVASSACGFDHPPQSLIPTFGAWLHAPDQDVRFGAACALRAIGTRGVIAPLLTDAIDDASQDVRFIAVNALAEVTGEMDFTDKAQFIEHDADYTGYWRRRRAALLGNALKR